MQKLAWLALAGACGTLARYAVAGLVHRYDGAAFPWGTLVVNISGCFLAGLLWALFENRVHLSGETRLIILIGFLGAFTTFSAYVLESSEMLRAGEWLYAAANIGMQNVLGFVAFFVGLTVIRIL